MKKMEILPVSMVDFIKPAVKINPKFDVGKVKKPKKPKKLKLTPKGLK